MNTDVIAGVLMILVSLTSMVLVAIDTTRNATPKESIHD